MTDIKPCPTCGCAEPTVKQLVWPRIDDPENPPPMDGTEILAYFPQHMGIRVAIWAGYRNQGWWVALGQTTSGIPPTHWQNLPPAPPPEPEDM